MIARIAVLGVAVVAIAWLATGLHAAGLEARGTNVGANQPGKFSIPKAREASRFYERSRRFHAGTRPIPPQADPLAFFPARDVPALRLAKDVTRREPANINAWAIVAGVAARLDPQLAARARRRIAELSPPVPPVR